MGKLSITDGCHCLAVHCEVHLSTIALYGDIVPVQVVKKASSSQSSSTIYLVYYTASWEIEGKKILKTKKEKKEKKKKMMTFSH